MRLPVTLKLWPSRTLGAALVLAHGLAALGLASSGLSPSLKLLVGLGLALSLAVALRRHIVRPSIAALTLLADGGLEIERPDGARGAASVDPHTTVFPWLVVLLLQAEGRAIRLTLPPDALGAEGHRQLRLWLRWQATPE